VGAEERVRVVVEHEGVEHQPDEHDAGKHQRDPPHLPQIEPVADPAQRRQHQRQRHRQPGIAQHEGERKGDAGHRRHRIEAERQPHRPLAAVAIECLRRGQRQQRGKRRDARPQRCVRHAPSR
jgi:hypothetical protein